MILQLKVLLDARHVSVCLSVCLYVCVSRLCVSSVCRLFVVCALTCFCGVEWHRHLLVFMSILVLVFLIFYILVLVLLILVLVLLVFVLVLLVLVLVFLVAVVYSFCLVSVCMLWD